MAFNRREEPKHSCPDIDGIITGAQDCEKQLTSVFHKLEGVIHPSLLEELREVNSWLSDLGGAYSELETVRSANASLRAWGSSGWDYAQEFDDQAEALTQQVKELKEQLAQDTQ